MGCYKKRLEDSLEAMKIHQGKYFAGTVMPGEFEHKFQDEVQNPRMFTGQTTDQKEIQANMENLDNFLQGILTSQTHNERARRNGQLV